MHPRYGQVCETALVLTNRVKNSNIIPLVPTGRLRWEKAANFGHGASVMRKVRITTLQLILLPQSSASAALTYINHASSVVPVAPPEPKHTASNDEEVEGAVGSFLFPRIRLGPRGLGSARRGSH